MEQLIKDYLISINHYLVADGDVKVLGVAPFIKYDEQHYDVSVTNDCLNCGVETISVDMSSLLTFMYAVKK